MSTIELIKITVNGNRHTVTRGTTVRELVLSLGYADQSVAVERNRDVVPRAEHEHVELVVGDRIEVVTFVGGG